MPKKINASKGKILELIIALRLITMSKSSEKNVRNTSKSCPVGKVCFGVLIHLPLLF